MAFLSFEDLQKIWISQKIWRLWLKNYARYAHFNFELLKGMAVLFFEVYPWNFDQLWIFYRQKKWCFIHFSVSLTEKLKFEKNPFLFSGVAPKWYIIVHNHDFLYHLGAILKKKKKLFSNFSFLVEDTEKWIKHHFFVYKISKFQGHISKNRTATPLRSSIL